MNPYRMKRTMPARGSSGTTILGADAARRSTPPGDDDGERYESVMDAPPELRRRPPELHRSQTAARYPRRACSRTPRKSGSSPAPHPPASSPEPPQRTRRHSRPPRAPGRRDGRPTSPRHRRRRGLVRRSLLARGAEWPGTLASVVLILRGVERRRRRFEQFVQQPPHPVDGDIGSPSDGRRQPDLGVVALSRLTAQDTHGPW